MGIEDWSSEEILRIASTSGKALEVRCAEAFLSQNWSARLGSYYADGALDIPRELDVLADRSAQLVSVTGVHVRMRVVISCRGFPEDRSPLTYSVSNASVPSFIPRIFAEHRGALELNGVGSRFGSLPDYEALSAERLLQSTGLAKARHIVAFDMIERTETAKKGDSQPPVVKFTRMKDGDSSFFKAVDSAIKAAQFWRREEYQCGSDFVTITIPILLLGGKFWDVCIDGGRIAEPNVANKGWMANFYPTTVGPARELMTLIWSIDDIRNLILALDNSFAWFTSEMNTEFESAKLRST